MKEAGYLSDRYSFAVYVAKRSGRKCKQCARIVSRFLTEIAVYLSKDTILKEIRLMAENSPRGNS